MNETALIEHLAYCHGYAYLDARVLVRLCKGVGMTVEQMHAHCDMLALLYTAVRANLVDVRNIPVEAKNRTCDIRRIAN